jgi:uncharacterized protein YodC (DUF2158 family)
MSDNQNRASHPKPQDPNRSILTASDTSDGLLEIGEPVRSKAGGPVMLVDDLFSEPGRVRYRCMWIEKGGGLKFADYLGEELVRLIHSPSDGPSPHSIGG